MKLYKYQEEGVEFLVNHHGGILMDEQGLGKTIQAIAFLNKVKPDYVLIACPAIMQETWKIHCMGLLKPKINYVVHSYEWFVKYFKQIFVTMNEVKSVAIIVDESHYIKTPTSKRSKAILALLYHANIKYKVLLTGTPITRDVDDLYNQLKIFYPTFCRNIYEYRKTYMRCIKNFFGDKYKGFKDELSKLQIIKLLKGCSIRRTKSKVGLELPPVIRTTITVDVKDKVAKDSMELLDYATRLITNETSYIELVKAGKEVNHITQVRRALGIEKVPSVIKYIEMMLENKVKKIVVFGVHRDVVKLLYESIGKKFNDVNVSCIMGDTPIKTRDKIINTFETSDTPQILVANVIACGVGVTLTSSHTVIFAELDWNPVSIMQAEARVHRLTQKEPVDSIFILAKHSIDEKVVGLLKDKLKIIREVM